MLRIDDYPILTDKALEERLENWRHWASSPTVRNRCRSIESRYKAPPMYDDPAPRFNVDIFDGAFLEKIIVHLPLKNRLAIVGWHYYKASPESIIKHCCIHPKRFGELMRNSWSMVKNQLYRRELAK